MIDFFEELGESAAEKTIELRVCFSSRYYPQVTMNKCQDMLLDRQAGHEEDITKYVKSKLKTRKGNTGEELRQAVQAKAQGVFMWVVLVVRILNEESDRGSNNASLRKCLDQIPGELHELFEDILQRGVRDDENLIPTLQWVSFAQRPLACEELYFAVRSDRPDFDVAKPWDQDEDDTETMRLFILNSSKGLAELTRGKKPIVQFIHESVRDYLRETGFRVLAPDLHSSLLGSTHEYLKRCCSRWIAERVIAQLALPERLPKAKSQEAKELRGKAATFFPFLEYSVNYLVYHAELACGYGTSQAGFVETFPQAQWTTIHNIFAIHDTRRYEITRRPTCILTSKGASRIVEEQLKQGWCPSYHHRVQISKAAITSGNIQVLRLMLGTPAQGNLTSFALHELVYLAIDKCNATALKIVLSHDNTHFSRHEFLARAYSKMKLDLVQELLAWPGLSTDDHWLGLTTSMVWFGRDNESALARFLTTQLRALLENVKEANSMVDRLVSWLANVGRMSNRLVLEVLVKTELTSNSANHKRRSAMVSACTQGFETLVHGLLDQGYRIDLMDGASYFDALSGASRNGHADALEIFLAHDPDIELQEADSYREVVQAVTMGRFGKVLKLLLDRSRGFCTQDRATYRGPLRQATQLGFNDIVQILRERGVTLPEDGATELELPSSVA